jgi:AcrR family transcriptional regulator
MTTGEGATRRERAVARSLDVARTRAEERVQCFIDGASELLHEPGRSVHDLTVGEVAARSGLSLRRFYQHFANKDELLLALFEETVRATVAHLRDGRGPRTLPGPPPGAVAAFAQRLLVSHPADAARAFAPLVALLRELLDAAGATGAGGARVGIVLQLIMFDAFAASMTGRSPDPATDAADELWRLIASGVAG